MDRLEQATQRADEAQRLLNSPLFDAAFVDTRAALLNAIASLDSLKDERAAELHAMVRLLAKVRKCLEVHIDTGKLAEREINGKRSLFPFRRQA